MSKKVSIVEKKDGYYVKINDYQTGPLPSLEAAQKRADREILISTSEGFSWRRYVVSLSFLELAMIIAGVFLDWTFAGFAGSMIVTFTLHSVFSVLAALVGK